MPTRLEKFYRNQPPEEEEMVDMTKFIAGGNKDGGGSDEEMVDMTKFIAAPQKKNENSNAGSLPGKFSGSQFSLPSLNRPDDPIADRILKNKRREIGKTETDPKRKLAEMVAGEAWNFGRAMTEATSGTGFLSRQNVNAALMGEDARNLQAAAQISPEQIKAAQRATKIQEGDVVEITKLIKERKEDIKTRRQQTPSVFKPMGAMDLKMDRMPAPNPEGVEANRLLDDEEDDLLDTAVAALRQSIAEKYDQQEDKSPETRKYLGSQLRSALEDIGLPETFSDEMGMIKYAMENESADSGTIDVKSKLPEYMEERDYKNELEVLKSVTEAKGRRLEELSTMPDVVEFLDGDEDARVKLSENDNVKEVRKLVADLTSVEKEFNTLADRYPQVKSFLERQTVIDAFASHVISKREANMNSIQTPRLNSFGNFFGDAGRNLSALGKDLQSFVVGDELDTDEEVRAVSQATGLSEDRVRQLASEAKMPSELRRGYEYFANTFRSTAQWGNRLIMSKAEADIANREIESSKYHKPAALQLNLKNFNIYALTDQAMEGISQFAAYSTLSAGFGAGLRMGGQLVSGGGRLLGRVPGVSEAISRVPALERRLGTVGEALAPTSTIGQGLKAGSPLAKVINSATKARTYASTYASGYASSYEDAYQEAKEFSSDESKREAYAGSIAFLNGISELLLPDIDVAKRLVAMGSMKQLLRDGRVSLGKMDLAKQFFAKMGSTMGQETLEEYIPMFGEIIQKDRIFGYETSTAEFMNTLAETTINTIVSSAGMGLMAGQGRSASSLTKSALYEAGRTPDRVLAAIDGLRDKGELTEQQAVDRKTMVNTMADILKALPSQNTNGEELSEHARVEMAAQIYRQRVNEAFKKKSDKSVHSGYDAAIADAQAQIDSIMGGSKTATEQRLEQQRDAEETPQPDVVTPALADIGFGDFGTMETPLDAAASSPQQSFEAGQQIGAYHIDAVNADGTYVVTDDTGSTIRNANESLFSGLKVQERAPSQEQQQIAVPAAEEQVQPNEVHAPLPPMQTPPPVLVGENPVAQQIAERYNLTDMEEIADDDNFTIFMPAHEGGLATMLGGEVRPSTTNAVKVTFAGRTLKQYLKNQQDATQESETEGGQGVQGSGRPEYSRPQEREQEPAQERAPQPQANNSDSVPGSRAEAPSQLGLKPIVRVYIDDAGQLHVVDRNAEVSQETPSAPAPLQERIDSVYQFGHVRSVAVDAVMADREFHPRMANRDAIEHLRENPTDEPILIFRHPNGKMYILDGKARLAAAKLNKKKRINARFLNGTVEQARQVGAATRPSGPRTISERVNRVSMKEPESFEEYVLQRIVQMLSVPVGIRRPAFRLKDFADVMGFGGINQNRLSVNYGKRMGKADISSLTSTGLVSDSDRRELISFDDFLLNWTYLPQGENADQLDLRNQLGDIILSFHTKEDAVRRLEEIQGVPADDARSASLVPLYLSRDEAVYAGDNSLSDVLTAIDQNIDQVELTEAEVAYYTNLLRRNASVDGTFDMESMTNDLFYSDDPTSISLREKLILYGTIKRIEAEQSAGDTGGESFVEAANDEETDYPTSWDRPDTGNYFSRDSAGNIPRITAKQARKIANVFRKVFKGLRVIVGDRDEFQNALKRALNSQREGLGEQALMLMDQLRSARAELTTAENAFRAKRQQLDRDVAKDQEDLFGERASQADNPMFGERVDPKARGSAIKPYTDRVQKARAAVNSLQKKLDEALKQGPQQTSMFQVDVQEAEVRLVGDESNVIVQQKAAPLTPEQYERKYGKQHTKHRVSWYKHLSRTMGNGLTLRTNINILAQRFGLAPEILFTSAMEEGMEKRLVSPDEVSEAYVTALDDSAQLAFPVDGFFNYGLDTFGDEFTKLVSKNYLPAEFAKNFMVYTAVNERGETVRTAAFKNDEAALMAKAAVLRQSKDQAARLLDRMKVDASERMLNFATLVFYNAGPGTGRKMLESYLQKGYLKSDSFLDPNFTPASWTAPFNNVQRRMVNAGALVDMGYFSKLPTNKNTVMLSKDNRVLGFVTEGTVYLNPDETRLDTPMHEIGGHILAQWARDNQPVLYAKIVEVARQAPKDVVDAVRKNYPELMEGSDLFWEEVFATALGMDERNMQRAANLIGDRGFLQRVRQVFAEIYQALVNAVIDLGTASGLVRLQDTFTEEEFVDMSLSDFANLVGEKLMSGRRLSVSPSADPRGFSDYAFLAAEDFVYDKWGNPVSVKPSVMREIALEKQYIKDAAIESGGFMLAPDGSPSLLTEDQWLTIRTRRFQRFDNPKAGIYMPGQTALVGEVLRSSNGEPRVFYHGTAADFTSFRDDRAAYFAQRPEYAENFSRRWFWADYSVGGSIKPVFIKATKPFDVRTKAHRELYNEAASVGAVSGFLGDGDTLDYVDVQGLLNYFDAKGMKFDAIVNIFENVPAMGADKSVAILNPANVKSAISNTTFSDESGDLRFQRIGVNSNLTEVQRTNLELAQRMAADGVSMNDIFLSTGWFLNNVDKQWRYELPNDNVSFRLADENSPVGIFWRDRKRLLAMEAPELAKELVKYPEDVREVIMNAVIKRQVSLADILDYPELYQAHPELATYKVTFYNPEVLGSWGRYNNERGIDLASRSLDEMYLTLRHEVQHALQETLGFERGASSEVGEIYRKRKVTSLRRNIENLNKQLARLKNVRTNEDLPQMEYLTNTIADYQSELDELESDPDYWANYFYRNFAGEREATSVEVRSKLPDEIRVLTPPIQRSAASAITWADNLEIKKTYVHDKADQRSRPEAEVEKAKVDFNPDGSVKVDRITELKRQLKEQWQSLGNVGIMSDNVENFRKSLQIYKTLLELGIEYAKRGADNFTEFFTDRRVLDAMGVRSYEEIPKVLRQRINTMLRMNAEQLQIVDRVVSNVLKSKVKDLKRKMNRELEAVQDELAEAGKIKKRKYRVRMNEDGQWEPLPVKDADIEERTKYLERLRNWQPTTQGMTTQQVRELHEKMGIFLPDEMYSRAATRLALSHGAMQHIIQDGLSRFGPRFLSVVKEVIDAREFNEEARTAFIANILNMGIFPRDVANKIAQANTREATKVSNMMNLRRLVAGAFDGSLSTVAKEVIRETLGYIGEQVVSLQENITGIFKSNEIPEDVQASYEMGVGDLDKELADIEEEERDIELSVKPEKITPEESKAEAERALNELKGRNRAATKKEVIDRIKERIKSTKC